MVSIIIGEINATNTYYIDDIVNKYPKGLIIRKSSSKGFKAWIRNVKRPIIGDRLLVILYETSVISRREFDSFKEILNEIKDHDYIDIIWQISKTSGDFNSIVTDMNFILLRKTMYVDFRRFIKSLYPNVDNKVVKYIASRVGYNNNMLNLYKDKLNDIYNNKEDLSIDDVNSIITAKHLKPILDVLLKLLNRDNSGLRDYYLYCERYGKTWTHNFFIDSLEDVLKLKIKYFKGGKITLFELKNNEKYKKYFSLVKNSKIMEVYMMLLLLQGNNRYPIESYKNYKTNVLLESEGGNRNEYYKT